MTEWPWERIKVCARIAAAQIKADCTQIREDPMQIAISEVSLFVTENPLASWKEACNAGRRGIYDAWSQVRHDWGRNGTADNESHNGYLKWWLYDGRGQIIPGNNLDYMALKQVMAKLPDKHVERLMQYTFSDDIRSAAEAAGIPYSTYHGEVEKARNAFLRLWFDFETPPSRKHYEKLKRPRAEEGYVCPSGHFVAGENALVEMRDGRKGLRCRMCRMGQRARYKAKKKLAA